MSNYMCACQGPESRVAYLAAKRPIDHDAYNQDVVRGLMNALQNRRMESMATGAMRSSSTPLRVFDLGAGTLSMLPLICNVAHQAGYSTLSYSAFDSDEHLLLAAAENLVNTQGFKRCSSPSIYRPLQGKTGLNFVRHLESPDAQQGIRVILDLCVANVLDLQHHVGASGTAHQGATIDCSGVLSYPDLIVGSGFADLLPGDQLSSLLARLAPGGVAYLPITFEGITRFEPSCMGSGNIPSDDTVSDLYHEHLRRQGQHIDPEPFIAAVQSAGGSLACRGPSIWRVEPDSDMYPWMTDFVSAGTAVGLWSLGWDPAAWRARLLARRATILVGNVDILLHLPTTTRSVSLPASIVVERSVISADMP